MLQWTHYDRFRLPRVGTGPVLSFVGVLRMGQPVKVFKAYDEQLALLVDRGMEIEDWVSARDTLRRVNYYRLSGYWYPFRIWCAEGRQDDFVAGTRFRDVVTLYEFDARLRAATFAALMPVELALRALIGHELGRVDPCSHLDPAVLGPTARVGDRYKRWLQRYNQAVAASREDFVAHHAQRYGGRLPVWAATEVLDWGALSYLYGFAPLVTQAAVAAQCDLKATQLSTWMRSLNVIRNVCAHHGRLFNRVHAIKPRVPKRGEHLDLDELSVDWGRTFGQLTLVQYLADRLGVGNRRLLPSVLETFPNVRGVPIAHLGAPANWQDNRLWLVHR